jgi:hypothetical protein
MSSTSRPSSATAATATSNRRVGRCLRGPNEGAASEASVPRTLAEYPPHMIKSVHFTGFRSLKDVELRLGPMTVLVGPNATGKSTVLRGLEPSFVKQDVAEYWQRDRERPLLRRIVTDEGQESLTGHRGGRRALAATASPIPPPTSPPRPRGASKAQSGSVCWCAERQREQPGKLDRQPSAAGSSGAGDPVLSACTGLFRRRRPTGSDRPWDASSGPAGSLEGRGLV